ncbi:Immunoglobulin superfamily member 10, partial [Clarias magur]
MRSFILYSFQKLNITKPDEMVTGLGLHCYLTPTAGVDAMMCFKIRKRIQPKARKVREKKTGLQLQDPRHCDAMHAAALLIVTFLVAAGAGASEIKVNTEPSVNATHGETVTLSCSIEENDETTETERRDIMQAAAFLAVTVLLASSTRATEVNMSSQSTGEIKCGEDVTLHCRLSQNKVIKLEISQISNPATDSSTVLCKSTTNEVNAIGCRYIKGQDLALAIKAAAKSDNGTYICKEQNNLDHRNKTFNLHVT